MMWTTLALVLSACGGDHSEALATPRSLVQAARIQKTIQGGGHDIVPIAAATVQGYRANYTIVQANGTVTVTSKIDPANVQVFQNIKLLKFADKYVSFDIDGLSGQVYRLYQAAFNRKPDLAGLGYWIYNAQTSNLSMDNIASSFLGSSESLSLYGQNPTNDKLLTATYSNILHRAPDQVGYNWWLNVMNAGNVTEQAMLLNFSESAENKSNTLPDMLNGIDYVPYGVILLKGSSYENRITAIAAIGPQAIPNAGNLPGWNTVAYAFADFFQDGSYSMITHTQESDNGKPYAQGAIQGHIKIWKKDSTGTWIDHSSDLLSNNSGCILARKILIADFNGDGLPDAYISCSGFDALPYAGESQRIILSDATTHKYKNISLPVIAYAHGATAADIDHDGKIDVVVADMRGNGSKNPLYVLKGNGDGTFNVNYSMISRPEIDWQANGPIFTVELIDFDKNGTYGLIAGGIESDVHRSMIIPYDSAVHSYATKPVINLPTEMSHATPYDFIFDSATNTIYIDRVNDVSTWGTNFPANVGNSIQKVDYRTLNASIVFTHTGYYYQPEGLTWIDWIGFYGGNVVSLNSGFGLSIKK
jgi:hypothetical protein